MINLNTLCLSKKNGIILFRTLKSSNGPIDKQKIDVFCKTCLLRQKSTNPTNMGYLKRPNYDIKVNI